MTETTANQLAAPKLHGYAVARTKARTMFEIPGYDNWKLTAPEDDRSCFVDGEYDPQMDTVREFDAMDRVVTPDGQTAVVVGCEWSETNEKRRFKVQYPVYDIAEDGEELFETDWFYAYDLKLAK